MPPTERWIAGGARLHAWEWPGPEPACLFLHGIGNYGRYWDLVAERVGARKRLVAPDARGHGDSDRPESGYRDADFVDDALRVADALALSRFVLCGHSLGGRHAIELAVRVPERVLGLVVVDSGPDVLPAARERARRLTTARPGSFADEAEAEAYLRRTSPGYADRVYADRLRFALRPDADGRLAWRSSREALLATMASGPRGEETWATMARLGCPAIVIRGTRSNALSAETARRMVAAMRDARLVEVDAGHNVPLERPDAVADAILAFGQVS